MSRLSAADTRMMDAVLHTDPNQEDIDELAESHRMRRAFETYFVSTPEGKEEGRWINEPGWQWLKAGSPVKIEMFAHPLRSVTFAAFEAQWREMAANGTPMTMTPAAKPKFKFGVRVG